MKLLHKILVASILILSAAMAWSDTNQFESGGDTFISGALVNETLETSGDAFAAARTVTVSGQANGDLHATGLDVTVNADTSEDLYAFGGSVLVRSQVAKDLTIAGFSVRTSTSSATNGNARMFGNTATIEGSVLGSLLVTAQDVVLNAPIEGDVRILARSISFGSKARIGGILTYSTTDKISVPDSVVPPERVVFEKASLSAAWDQWEDVRKDMPILPTTASLLLGFIVSLLFFLALGALTLGFMPKRLSKMRQSIARAPGRSILSGVIGLSMLFGMVPVIGLTIIGLPFVFIVVLTIIVAWTLGYALGAYSVAMRIWAAFGGDENPSNLTRLLVFGAAITVIALLNFIPFVGWVANYTLVLLGIGAITNAIFQNFIGNPGEAFDVDMKPIKD